MVIQISQNHRIKVAAGEAEPVGEADSSTYPQAFLVDLPRRAVAESGEMLAFAHIPTGTAANKGFDIDGVNSRIVEPAIALTAIGADTEIGRATP
jgi:hypothetical protein